MSSNLPPGTTTRSFHETWSPPLSPPPFRADGCTRARRRARTPLRRSPPAIAERRVRRQDSELAAPPRSTASQISPRGARSFANQVRLEASSSGLRLTPREGPALRKLGKAHREPPCEIGMKGIRLWELAAELPRDPSTFRSPGEWPPSSVDNQTLRKARLTAAPCLRVPQALQPRSHGPRRKSSEESRRRVSELPAKEA